MYVPRFAAVEHDAEIRAMVDTIGSGWLVTVEDDGVPTGTLLPITWKEDRVNAHIAKANPHWRGIDDGAPVLVIIGGPETYVSPSWYPSKAAHGSVVPTWNYTAVHLTGTARIRHDPDWLRGAVVDLTERHEAQRRERWQVADAPEEFIDAMLRAIVGIEVQVTRVEAKAKLSQNRDEADRQGVIYGLRDERNPQAAAIIDAMERTGTSAES